MAHHGPGRACREGLAIAGLLQRFPDDEAAAGAMGFWLESRPDEHGVDDATLRELRALAPRERRYALGAGPDEGLPAAGWNVILPDGFVEPEFEGMPWSEL